MIHNNNFGNLIFYTSLVSFLVPYFIDLFKVKYSEKVIPYLSTFFIFLLCIFSYVVFFRQIITYKIIVNNDIFTWITIGSEKIDISINFSTISVIMMTLVSTVSFLVHLYSISYMKHYQNYSRFMINVSFFTFCMTLLVCSDNFLQLFFGWEGVGFASYLLINYYNKKAEANFAAMKAFLVNRFADIFMIAGIVIAYHQHNSFNFAVIQENIYPYGDSNSLVAILLFLGCMGKSAQFLMHVWLPDAMMGPTPVSALMHAATMVTAGVLLLCKCSFIFEYSSELVNYFIVTIGSITAIYAGFYALNQNDIKKSIAYSTCSQLGYMVAACGIGFYSGAFFHVITHGFFKALLFLCAGAVIFATGNQDFSKMPAKLYKKLPITFICMLIGTLAISGFPPLSGYYSKDAIIMASNSVANNSYFALFSNISLNFGAFLTSLYSFRVLLLTFFAKNQTNEEENEKIDLKMNITLIILSLFAIFVGHYLENIIHILQASIVDSESDVVIISQLHQFHSHLPTILAVLGLVCYTLFHFFIKGKIQLEKCETITKIIDKLRLLNTCSQNDINEKKLSIFDVFYEKLSVNIYKKLANFVHTKIDFPIINKIFVESFCRFFSSSSSVLARLNSGKINAYTIISISVFGIILLVSLVK